MSMATFLQSLIKPTVTAQSDTKVESFTTVESGSPDSMPESSHNASTGNTRKIDVLEERPWGSGLFSLRDIRVWVEDQSYTFHTRLNELLRAKKIDLGRAMHFRINGFGNVVMVNEHEDAASIEALINGNHSLRKQFVSICATSRFLKAADAVPEFSAMYKQNPERAIAEYNISDHSPSPYLFKITSTIDRIHYAFSS